MKGLAYALLLKTCSAYYRSRAVTIKVSFCSADVQIKPIERLKIFFRGTGFDSDCGKLYGKFKKALHVGDPSLI